ncbi:Tn3 family transposase, partial [Escherichia coli]|nr:Tn3 family transposase [Escherichia coli]
MDNGIDWFFNFLYVKLASYPRQNNLAVALREVGRIERTLFIIEW